MSTAAGSAPTATAAKQRGTPQRSNASKNNVTLDDAPLPPEDRAGDDVSMEGHLVKMAKRGRKQWNDRYFRLCGNSLSYYHSKSDKLPKASFPITVGACVVGNLYMDQRQRGTKKDLLYCFRITFDDESDDSSTVHNDSAPLSPTRSVSGGNAVLSDQEDDDEVIESSSSTLEKASFRRKNKAKRKTLNADSSDTAAPAEPSMKHLHTSPRTAKSRRRIFSSKEDESMAEQIPPPIMQEKWIESAEKQRANHYPEDENNRPSGYSYIEEQQRQEQQLIQSHFREAQKEYKKKSRKRMVDGGKLALAAGAAVTVGVLTAGVGLVAGLAFLGAGAAAGGTGVVGGAAYQRILKKSGELVVASTSYEEARTWKSALDACLVSQTVKESTWGQLFVMDGRNARTALLPTEIAAMPGNSDAIGDLLPRSLSFSVDENRQPTFVEPNAKWQPMEGGWATLLGTGTQGLRIYREERHASEKRGKISVKESACPPLKAHAVLAASPLQAFLCLMSLARVAASNQSMEPSSEQRASFRIVERMDDHTDVIHLFFRPLYLFPSWTTARDFVLFRYWRYEPDGSYVICVDSVKHPKCPPHPDYTRGGMHGVYTIAPKKSPRNPNDQVRPQLDECLLTFVVQVDPCGWVPRSIMPTYSEAFGVSALLHMLDVKDALDQDRFLPVPLESTSYALPGSYLRQYPSHGKAVRPGVEDDPCNYDFSYSTRETSNESSGEWIASHPPTLARDMWAEPDANSFRVRGKTYKKDKIKINAGSSIGRLIAVDVVKVDSPIYSGFSNHPRERIQLALEREKRLQAKGVESTMPPFLFLVNIVLPGSPCYHAAYYYAIDDMSSIDGSDGTPSSKLCKQFIFGNDDDFRDKTFKLIPTIVEGNFVVRKAVGSTPAIMGTKLKQYYFQNERSFEVLLDCGSSAVATGVIRLCLGYAKTLVVDMGFLLEGNDETTLPERIIGCARMKHLDFATPLRTATPIEKQKHDDHRRKEEQDGIHESTLDRL